MPNFRVTWEIDVFGAADAREAAERARTTQLNPDTIATCFTVIEHDTTKEIGVDLMEDAE